MGEPIRQNMFVKFAGDCRVVLLRCVPLFSEGMLNNFQECAACTCELASSQLTDIAKHMYLVGPFLRDRSGSS